MKWLGFVCALSWAGQALASFEMLLVLDSTQNVVHRYDADNNVYLGSFGGGTLSSVRGIDVDQASQTAFITHENGYSAWNYNTGDFRFYTNSIGGLHNDVFVTAAGQILFTNVQNSGTSAGQLVSGLGPTAPAQSLIGSTFLGPYTSVVQYGNGDIYALRGVTGDLARFNSSGVFQAASAVPAAGTASKGDMESGLYVALRPNGQAISVNFQSLQTAVSNVPSNPFTTTIEFAGAHPGTGWGLGTGTTGTRVQRYVRNAGGVGSFVDAVGPGRTLTQVSTPVGLAVVVAPEPGMMVVLGLGVAAMLRRRRR